MKRTKKESIEYLKENYSKKTKSEIISELKYSWNYIQKICCLNNIKREFIEGKNYGKYSKLTNLKNLETCYWIGFLLADGHIYKEMSVQANLSNKDRLHISKLEDYIGCFPIIEYKNHFRLTISDTHLAKYLSDQFIWKSNKTKNPPIFPKLDNIQMFSLIIGFIDGDGSISKSSITVKCDISWKNILEDFYYNLTKDKKSFNITGCGCSIIYINKLETLFQIKETAEKLNLPIMDRKWSVIKRRIIKYEKYEIVKKLIESGKRIKEIKIETNFSYSLIYRVSKEYNKKI